MKQELFKIAAEAGEKILQSSGGNVENKEDGSPLTIADIASHNHLCTALSKLKNIPILSEEDVQPYHERKNWDTFWMIDPLDGTKEFIAGLPDFCINISLMEKNKPIIGLIYAPILKEFYYAEKSKGFSYDGLSHPTAGSSQLVAAKSRFHNSEMTQSFLEANKIKKSIQVGAAIKFGRLALGEINIYPRFEGSKEWDIAAGHLILLEAGGQILDLNTKKPPKYNKKYMNNNFFISFSNSISKKLDLYQMLN
ncbi:MAG TPA: 3'(2'),5'-bisphosphate nucleotidase CysQ [Holosporales bacterium]|nr:3'(2'),5'-bisphosphate nucleotidase CysQ [Holosporales bacterium]